jgi:SAM-dependent methyltransferase
LHHSPNTARAIEEVFRVLRPGGTARIMIYHRQSITGYLLWLRYGLFAGRGLDEVYSQFLESPGTQAFSVEQAREMCRMFSHVTARSQLSFGDLLQGAVGQRHRGPLLDVAKRLWPRGLIERLLPSHGLLLLIEATK